MKSNSKKIKETSIAEVEQTASSLNRTYIYDIEPKPFLTNYGNGDVTSSMVDELFTVVSPEDVECSSRSSDNTMSIETKTPLDKETKNKIARAISVLQENKTHKFYYMKIANPVLCVSFNLTEYSEIIEKNVKECIPNVNPNSIEIYYAIIRWQSTAPVKQRNIILLENSLAEEIPPLAAVKELDGERLFARMSAQDVALVLEQNSWLYSRYDQDKESDFIIRPARIYVPVESLERDC